MNKEDFLAMSLPYHLILLSPENKDGSRVALKFNTQHLDSNCSLTHDLYKPALHPLSDLTKEIEHNGEKFVPIVKLAQIMYPNLEWRLCEGLYYATVGNAYCTFEYDSGYECFLMNNSAQMPQIVCLLKLIEWHFDIAGLIEKGEAIDVNTLVINRYK
jgi:hypothetical protein